MVRVETMVNYVYTSRLCRSELIGKYFGDDIIKACGMCDVCLNLKKSALTQDEFQKIHSKIIELIRLRPLPPKEIITALNGVSKEKTMEVIRFLQAENIVLVTDKGLIQIRD